MSAGLVDDLHVRHGDNQNGNDQGDADRTRGEDHGGPQRGTVATIAHHLHRPARLAAEPATPPPSRAGSEFSSTLQPGPPRQLSITGALDFATADEFADRLDVASRGGVYPLVLDLTEVDVLASAAVSVLLTAHAGHRTHATALTIHATAGSAPDQVLNLVGLPHTTREPAPQ